MDGRLPASAPLPPSNFEVRVAFTNLTFQNPMGVIPVPGSNRLAVWERIVAAAAAFTLVAALPVTDEVGFALAVLLIGQHWWRTRDVAAPATE